MRKGYLFKKEFVLGIAILFIGITIVPITTSMTRDQNKHLNHNLDGIATDIWWNNNWNYRKQITINHTKVSADLHNFPVLITYTSADFITHAQPDGDDFVFTDTANNGTLNHEIEYYNNTTGKIITWVNVSLLSSTQDTILYLYYGNPSCPSQQHVEDTWDTHFVAVHHLEETTGIITDSTSYTNDGMPYGNLTQTAIGTIDGADYFDGVDDHITLPQVYTTENQFTMEAWIYPETGARYFISQWSDYQGVFLQIGVNPDHIECYLDSTGLAISILSLQTWYYIVITYNGTTAQLYRNAATSINETCNAPTWPAEGMVIGDRSAGDRQFHGIIDEVRFSNVARDNNWITTCYSNQNDTASFYTVGNEETQPIVNHPPHKPNTPSPANNAVNVNTHPVLSVLVTDPDGDTMIVSFYDASTHNIIAIDQDIPNGTRAEVTWWNLNYDTTYTWYAVANDTILQTQSDLWSFTTESEPDNPPEVSLIKPQEKSLYFRDRRLLPFPKILIIGFITIQVEAQDDKGIDRVEFYIDGTLKNTISTPSPDNFYTWTWNERCWLRSKHTITVVAIDTNENTDEATQEVSIHNFPWLHPFK